MAQRHTPRLRKLREGPAREEIARLAKEERRARWRARWARLRAFWGRLGSKAKRWAAIGAVTSSLGKPAWKLVVKVRALYEARSIGRAELPKTGQPTTAMDFVAEPKHAAPPLPGEPKSSKK